MSSILAFFFLLSCSSDEPDSSLDLAKRGNGDLWRQVALRYPATGELVPVSGNDALQLKISDGEVLMITDSSSCAGKISETTIQLDYSCSYISPVWLIVEQTEDRMYIYPRLGAMYYYGYVMERMDSSQCHVPARCDLEPETGFCDAHIPRYYYDKKDKKCKEFIWGGCEGVVPFNTIEECKACECTDN